MSNSLRNGLIRLTLIGLLACYYVGGLVADDPREKLPSQFASLADLTVDLERQISTLESATGSPSTAGNWPTAVHDQAHVIGIVAGQMAIHDQRHEAPVADRSPAAADELRSAVPGPDLALFSRQFPLCYQQIRQGIYSSRFADEHAALAARCSTLALLADYCGQQEDVCPDPARRTDWRRVCYELRDSAAEVNLACHAGSQTAAVAALGRLQESCAAWQSAAGESRR